MSVTKICPCCKYPFKAIDFRAKTATFCSKDCERAFRNEMPLEKYRRKHGIPINE